MDHHCVFTGNCVGKGTFKYFFLFNFYVSLQTLIGFLIIVKSKIYHEERLKLQNLNLNLITSVLYYSTYPQRELIAYFYVPDIIPSRTFLYLEEIEDVKFVTNYNPHKYRDDILYIMAFFFVCLSTSMLISFVIGVRSNQLYIEKIKGNNNAKKEKKVLTVKEVYRYIFYEN